MRMGGAGIGDGGAAGRKGTKEADRQPAAIF